MKQTNDPYDTGHLKPQAAAGQGNLAPGAARWVASSTVCAINTDLNQTQGSSHLYPSGCAAVETGLFILP